MNWPALLIAITTVLYLGTAIGYFYAGRHPMALIFGAYTLSNIGFIWDAMK